LVHSCTTNSRRSPPVCTCCESAKKEAERKQTCDADKKQTCDTEKKKTEKSCCK